MHVKLVVILKHNYIADEVSSAHWIQSLIDALLIVKIKVTGIPGERMRT